MPIANGDVLRVVAKLSFGGNDIQNVYHLKTTVSSDPGDTAVLASIVDNLDVGYDNIDTIICNDVQFETIAVWNLTTNTFIGEDAWSTLTVGGGAAANLPVQNSALVLFNTNVNRSQGRKFLPLFTTGALDTDGSLSAATMTAMGNFATWLLNGITGTGWSGVYGNWNPDLLRFVEWATGYIHDTMKTQRRRYVGSGS